MDRRNFIKTVGALTACSIASANGIGIFESKKDIIDYEKRLRQLMDQDVISGERFYFDRPISFGVEGVRFHNCEFIFNGFKNDFAMKIHSNTNITECFIDANNVQTEYVIEVVGEDNVFHGCHIIGNGNYGIGILG